MYDVDTTELVKKTAEELKKVEEIKPAPWASLVKTGTHKERPPAEKDWWYKRAASILRWVSMRGPIGVQKLRIKYGGRKNRGVKAERFYMASGNIIRKILQQLEKAELIKKGEVGVHKGRMISSKGILFLNNVAKSLKPAEKKPAEKKAEEEPPAKIKNG